MYFSWSLITGLSGNDVTVIWRAVYFGGLFWVVHVLIVNLKGWYLDVVNLQYFHMHGR